MITRDPAATQAFGKQWARTLEKGEIVALYGDLGAGKTTLAKAMISELTGIAQNEIHSPTFTLMNCYEGESTPIYHFDLYRLGSVQEFIGKGLIDFFTGDGICLIEWPEKIAALLPKATKSINLTHIDTHTRRIDV